MKPTQKRIDRSVRYMKRFLASEDAEGFRSLTPDAQMLYIIGILICDNAGFMPQDKLQEAVNDSNVRYAALIVASRSGLLVAPGPADRYA